MILLIELEIDVGGECRITSVSLRCTEAYFSVTNDHVLKVLNFSCLSQNMFSRHVFMSQHLINCFINICKKNIVSVKNSSKSFEKKKKPFFLFFFNAVFFLHPLNPHGSYQKYLNAFSSKF